jgi:LacI family repressor for deo operon, udp, cdd, tsx, nupC, and nupG
MPSAIVHELASAASRPKMQDIARIAGVSVATVSRALAGSPRVNEETRARIEAAVRQTGYVVNHAAQGLRLQRSNQILVLLPTIANPFFAEIVQGIEEQAQAAGFGVLVGSTEGIAAREVTLARHMLTGAVDGLILLTGHLPAMVAELPDFASRVIAVSERIPGSGITTVSIDNTAAAATAIAHLAKLGHRHIAHIAGPARNILTRQRIKGYRAGLARAGLVEAVGAIVAGDFTIGSGERALEALLRLRPRPTAVFCSNDEMAMGALRAARAAGLRVPRDLSIVGFDDISFAVVTDPPLTTLRQPRRQLGQQAAALLTGGASTQGRDIRLDFELVIRESTCPPNE